MLGGHGQRLRVAKAGSTEGGKRGKIGVQWDGQAGVDVWNGRGWREYNGTGLSSLGIKGTRWTRNGVVIGLNGVLDMPLNIGRLAHRYMEGYSSIVADTIRNHKSLSHLSHLLTISEPLPSPLPDDLKTTPHLTIFAPSNDAFRGAFDDIEKAYLEGPYGAEGFGRILAGGVVSGVGKHADNVGWSDTWNRRALQGKLDGGRVIHN
jgi:solute carrier family 25 carnitine/acylcarnitine transporter 20/29